MNLAIDIGNTRIKWALFDGERMLSCHSAMVQELAKRGTDACSPLLADQPESLRHPQEVIVCATGVIPWRLLGLAESEVHLLSAHSPLPIALDYESPETLGPDRIAAACGAASRFEGQPCLIIDAGTCITVDALDASRTYHGGAIMPGISMKFHALHTFTAKLPLLQIDDHLPHPVAGRTTQQSMESGVYVATLFALQGYIAHYRKDDPNTAVVLTGGDAQRLWDEGLKETENCIIEPHLVMMGLNKIIQHNEK